MFVIILFAMFCHFLPLKKMVPPLHICPPPLIWTPFASYWNSLPRWQKSAGGWKGSWNWTHIHTRIYIYICFSCIYIYIYYIYICVCVCVKMCIYVNLNTHHILYIIGELMFHWKSGKDIGKWCRALTDFEDAKPEDASIFSQRPKKPTGPTVRYPKHPVLRYSLVCCFGLEAASPRHLIVSVKEQVTCQNNRRRVVLVFQSH